MKLIRSVEIQKFRSIEKASIPGMSDISAFVGPNNSGKSNVLRALNLFFNAETQPDVVLSFDVDYRLSPPSKKKKAIQVTVGFDLPEIFRFRKGLEGVEQLLGRSFRIRKTWTLLYPFEPTIEIARDTPDFRRVVGDDADRVTQFLSLLSFRYIPNRAVPAEVVRAESLGVLKPLATRILARSGRSLEPLIDGMTEVAKGMVAPIAADLKRACAGISDLELSTPGQIFEMMGQAGFRATVSAGGKVEDTSLGAGVQSLLMFHVLQLIDQSQFQGFGWKQAAVWAVEEPESSLHRQLQLRVLALFRSYALPDYSRFQIVVTTHNDIFVYGAEAGYAVELDNSFATVVEKKPLAMLADWAANVAVTGWTHPALKFPTATIVLVEGKHDRSILERAAQLCGVGLSLRFCTPSQLDPTLAGDGVENVRKFVTLHAGTMRQRLSRYPILVLLDWDVGEDKLGNIKNKYGPNGVRYVSRMDEGQAEPALDPSFRGIERFFSKRLIDRAAQKGILPGVGKKFNGTLMVNPEELGRAKPRLAELFCDEADRADCSFLRHALDWAEETVVGLVS
jgi:hypothetical protein